MALESTFAMAGGLSTKLHAACIDERTGVSFDLSGGERHDATGFELVWEGIEAVIPSRANRRETIHHDTEKYKMRLKVERLFNNLKQFRRIATRYDKLARTFLAFVHLVAT